MKLIWKFNLILLAVFALGLAISGYVSWHFLQGNAKEQVIAQARLMIEAASSVRTYTSDQIGPLLERREHRDRVFHPQVIPFYAATENFRYLRHNYPDYTYKESTLNPTNLRDRATDWETDIITNFRNHPGLKEAIGQRDTPDGQSLFLARPIKTDASCLECHGLPAKAPSALLAVYGPLHGFGWAPNEVVGAQIVSVPLSLPVEVANRAFRAHIVALAAILIATLLVVDLALYLAVVRPVSNLSQVADRISTGELNIPEQTIDGKDEISLLKASFNRMHRSLKKAVELLEDSN